MNLLSSSFTTSSPSSAFLTKRDRKECLIENKLLMTKEASSEEEVRIINKAAIKGDIVTIDYALDSKFTIEPLFDTRGVVSFVLGWGNYLPGIHDLVTGMTAGSSKQNVNIDAGWGERNPELVFQLPKDTIKGGLDLDSLEIGTQLYLKSHIVYVSAIAEEYIEIDANPPLAGASYNCSLTLLRREDLPSSYVYRDGSKVEGKYQVATFALGCFWGGELAFMREEGVIATKVGYTQGHVESPTYNDVCTGETGHTEAIQVIFDSSVVSFSKLVKVAMERLGDSVYLINQVGNDVGTQYRHGIYYHDDEQQEVATKLIKSLGDDCATEIKPASIFYDAEDYHQQYLLKGGQSAKKNAKDAIRCYG